jgi:hypothetical protein
MKRRQLLIKDIRILMIVFMGVQWLLDVESLVAIAGGKDTSRMGTTIKF